MKKFNNNTGCVMNEHRSIMNATNGTSGNYEMDIANEGKDSGID